MDWLPADRPAIASILDRVPNGWFVLSAAHGETRCGALVRWVQQCAATPPMLVVAIEKGQALSPIIRDSHGFAVCQLHRDDRVLRRIFPPMPEHGVDPFISVPHLRTPSGAPVPLRTMSWFDCELVRHLDIGGDCELYVGVVHHASVVQPGAAAPCHCAAEPCAHSGVTPAKAATLVAAATPPAAKPPAGKSPAAARLAHRAGAPVAGRPGARRR